ncbi:MAG: glucose-6-phosphate dehydrogenase assembly protein OpcA [Bifidobacteriaceae bacterium]|jgi:glucose-6-phosphate dehydrogenase assembly protein OpcA|nr:glucose-6-phosphate dehydrogenase assembly protein OpcA [Bifidobacteriaceae bacterium]
MIIPLYATSTAQVATKLVELREDGGVAALGRVLTLIIQCEAADIETSIQAANLASMEHPCRVIVLTAEDLEGPASMDAQIRVGSDAGASEVIVLRLRGAPGGHLDAVSTPLLLPDAPVVVWWPGERPAVPARDRLGRLASRRITDAITAGRDSFAGSPRAALKLLTSGYSPGDSDLTWTRLTPWRAQLAAALEIPPVEAVTSATVTGPDLAASYLMGAWLADRLGVPVRRQPTDSPFLTAVEFHLSGGRRILLDKELEEAQAVLRITGQVDRVVSLSRRSRAESLAEELRRLEPDEAYGHLVLDALPAYLAAGAGAEAGTAGGTGTRGGPGTGTADGTGTRGGIGTGTADGTGTRSGIGTGTAGGAETGTGADLAAGPAPKPGGSP